MAFSYLYYCPLIYEMSRGHFFVFPGQIGFPRKKWYFVFKKVQIHPYKLESLDGVLWCQILIFIKNMKFWNVPGTLFLCPREKLVFIGKNITSDVLCLKNSKHTSIFHARKFRWGFIVLDIVIFCFNIKIWYFVSRGQKVILLLSW